MAIFSRMENHGLCGNDSANGGNNGGTVNWKIHHLLETARKFGGFHRHFGINGKKQYPEIYNTGAHRPEPMEKELSFGQFFVEIFVTDFMEF